EDYERTLEEELSSGWPSRVVCPSATPACPSPNGFSNRLIKSVFGACMTSSTGPTCSIFPSTMIAKRLARNSASSWACVTQQHRQVREKAVVLRLRQIADVPVFDGQRGDVAIVEEHPAFARGNDAQDGQKATRPSR